MVCAVRCPVTARRFTPMTSMQSTVFSVITKPDTLSDYKLVSEGKLCRSLNLNTEQCTSIAHGMPWVL